MKQQSKRFRKTSTTRPLSQHGLPSSPRSANSRSLAKRDPHRTKAIDAVNERLAALPGTHTSTLHPTKGFRAIANRRSLALRIMAESFSSGVFSTKLNKQILKRDFV